MEVENLLRTGDKAVVFTVMVQAQCEIWKVVRATTLSDTYYSWDVPSNECYLQFPRTRNRSDVGADTGLDPDPDATATELAVYRHLQSVYLEGLLVPKLLGTDELSEPEQSSLCAYLQAQPPPSDWDQEDWKDWGIDQYLSFVKAGQTIRLECIEGTTLAQYRDQGMRAGLDRSLLEGLMTLHGAGLLLGEIDEKSIVILDRVRPEKDSDYPIIMFTDLSHASVQRPRDIHNVLQRWRELSQLRSAIWDIKVTEDSDKGRQMLKTFVENHHAGVETPDLGPLVEACRIIRNRSPGCMPWFEDEENQKLIASLELSQIVHILRALALESDGRILGQLLLLRLPVEALQTHRLLHYQWLISALSCDRHHLDSAWWQQTHQLLTTASDNVIALLESSDQLLASLEVKRRKALTSRTFGQQENLSQILQQTLDDFKTHNLPWYHEQVLTTVEHLINHCSDGQCDALEGNGYIKQMSNHNEHTVYYHDLPRRSSPSAHDFNPRIHVGRRAQSMFPLPSNKTEGPSATLPSGEGQILSPPRSQNWAVPRGFKRDRDDRLEDEQPARSSGVKRSRIDGSTGVAAGLIDGPSGIKCYQSYADIMKDAIQDRHSVAQEDQTQLRRGTNEKPTPPPDVTSDNNGPVSSLAGVEPLQEPPETDCKDLEIIGEAVGYESSLCLPVKLRKQSHVADEDCELIIYRQRHEKGCANQDLKLQEPDWHKDSLFYSARFAQMQFERRRSMTEVWERICVGQVQVNADFLQAIQGDMDGFSGGLKGQAPLRGLIFTYMGRNRFSQRLDDLLANPAPSLLSPSSDVLEAMLEALVGRIHESGVCRLHLGLGNIRLVGAEAFCLGSAPFDERTSSTPLRKDTPVSKVTASSEAVERDCDFTNAMNQVWSNYPDRQPALELVNLAESARWCAKGVLDDQQRLRELKQEIRERYQQGQ
ncbi:MAG: hypothetical protein Q9170_005237 [Blastenia crenularia]